MDRKTFTVLAAALAILGIVALRAQSRSSVSPTAMDYVQIRQLVARYAFALDTGSNNGYDYADLFTADGEFVMQPPAKGRDQLAALARGNAIGPLNTTHYAMSLVIEPTADGAIGRQYVTEFNFNDNVPPLGNRTQWEVVGDKRGELSNIGGHYEDVYAKTPKGWRIKRRHFIPSKSGGGATAAQAALKSPVKMTSQPADDVTAANGSLSVMDYLQIEQLIASYGHALDSGFGKGDNGDAYAGLYTKDGVAFTNTKGYDALAALAREQPRGPKYVRHYLTNHVIEPSPDGATGKAYLAVLDIGEGGKPGTLFLGGHYEDTYVRTADGWRIKTRNLFPPKHGPQPVQASAR
jgi:hypothetical protein